MLSELTLSGIEIIIFRDDLNHPTVSGNKLHKLAPNIELALVNGCNSILSFGGPYSNHLHALAWACKESSLQSIGVVRGELQAPLTPTLKDCRKWGMKLIPMSRSDYREYQEMLSSFTEPCFANELSLEPELQVLGNGKNTFVLPEGGSNAVAIKSLANAYGAVFKQLEHASVTHAICATGTGATLAGLYQAAPAQIEIIGMQSVAEQDATFARVRNWLGSEPSRLTIEQSHLGRFGKITPSLTQFIDAFEAKHEIPLEPIYTGKALLKLSEMITQGRFKKADKILFIHTGGLQGKRV